jgi:aryl-alcohol dehydrogenase-like predicted oxidoreductase
MTIPLTRLGKTGLKVSRLALGTMTFGTQTPEDLSYEIMDKAVDAGINFFDTADVYPHGKASPGLTEEIIGRWFKGRRHSIVLATKAFGQVGPNPWDQGNSRKHLLDAIDASLKRLQTDYVDLYQLHHHDPATPIDETLEALDVIVKSGRARYVGVCNFLAYRLALALGRSETKRLVRVVSVQPRYNLLFREMERELFPLCAEEGIGVISYNPLAGGMLTGKHKQESGPVPGSRFSLQTGAGEQYRDRYWKDRELATVDKFVGLAGEAGVSPVTLAVSWVLANPTITAPIIGASQPNQLDDSLAAASYKLDPGLKVKLDELTVNYRRGDSVR